MTARCGRYHEASGGGAGDTVRKAGPAQPTAQRIRGALHRAGGSLDGRERPAGRRGRRRPAGHSRPSPGRECGQGSRACPCSPAALAPGRGNDSGWGGGLVRPPACPSGGHGGQPCDPRHAAAVVRPRHSGVGGVAQPSRTIGRLCCSIARTGALRLGKRGGAIGQLCCSIGLRGTQ